MTTNDAGLFGKSTLGTRTGGTGRTGLARLRTPLCRAIVFAAAFSSIAQPVLAQVAAGTLPTGATVNAGQATISTSGSNMLVNQGTARASLDWQSFSIGSGASVVFNQPSASAIALNRVVGNDVSQIFGSLSANGQVFLINPSGVVFAPGAQVNVGGIVASALNISDADFLAGRYVFNGNGAGSVVNQGSIITSPGGYAALFARTAANEGLIVARAGSVAIASGERVTMDFVGDGLMNVVVDRAALGALAANRGLIQADGGRVIMTARAAGDLVGTVLNQTGVIEAKSVSTRNGEIVLDGGSTGVTSVAGKLDASGGAGQTGGSVSVTGHMVGLYGADVNASGGAGGGSILIGGGAHGANPNVANAFRTYVDAGTTLNADAVTSGNGGTVVVWADDVTRYYGSLSARGGAEAGNGGFAEVSGKESLVFRGTADLRAPNGAVGTLLLDPRNIEIKTGGTDGVAANDTFAENSSTDATILPADLVTALNTANVRLQANNDITVTNDVDASGGGNYGLTLEAGRSIAINADVILNGFFTAIANTDDILLSVADRTVSTQATFSMTNGKSINTSTAGADITIQMQRGGGNAGFDSGNIEISALNAGSGNVLIKQDGQSPGSSIVRTAASLITAASVALDISNAANTSGTIGATGAGNAIRVSTPNLEARTQNGSVFLESVSTVNIGGATLGGLTGINAGTGNVTLASNDAVAQTEAITANTLTVKTLKDGGAAIALTATANEVATIDLRARNTADNANAAGAISYTDSSGFDVAAAHTTSTVTLVGGGAITDSGFLTGTTLTATTLNNGGAAITLDNASNEFTTVSLNARDAGNANNAAGAITYVDATGFTASAQGASTVNLTATTSDLTVGAGNIVTNSGTVTLTASEAAAKIIGTGSISTVGGATAGAAVTLKSDKMDVGAINSGTGLVSLTPNADARAIEVGTGASDASALGITHTELAGITTTGGVTIGSATNTGGITVVGAADQSAGAITGGTFTLRSNSGNIAINDVLTNAVDTTLQTTSGNISFGGTAGAVVAAGKTVTLTATGGNIEGAGGASFNNVTASTLNATASSGIGNTNALETIVSTLSFTNTTNKVQVTNSLGGGVTVSGTNAGTGSVNIAETLGSLTVGAADIVTNSGAVTLTASGVGQAIISAAGSDVSTIGGASAGAAVTLKSDNLTLGGLVTAGTGLVTLRPNLDAVNIQVGATATDAAGTLGVDDAELDKITTTGGLTIGSSSNTGTITVVGAADQATGATITGGTFTLRSNSGNIAVNDVLTNAVNTTLQTTSGNISFGGTAGAVVATGNTVTLTATAGNIEGDGAAFNNVTASTLNATASSGIGNTNALETVVSTLSFTNSTNKVQVSNALAGGLTASGTNGAGAVNITETAGSLAVGSADIVTTGGAVTLVASGANKLISSASGANIQTSGGAVTLQSDNIDLAGTIASGAGLVTLTPNANAVAIQVGTGAVDDVGILGITNTELDRITTTGGVTIGSATNTGGITVVGAADQATGATITGAGVFTLLSDTGNIVVNNALSNAVDTTLTTNSGNISFGTAGAITAATKTVTLTATAGTIEGHATALTNVTAGTLNATARDGIGTSNRLETAVSTLSFANTNNDVQVTNSLAGGVTVSGTNAGVGAVNLTETLGNLTVGGDIVTDSGAVTLTASGANKAIITTAATDVKTDSVGAGAAVTFVADNMTLNTTGTIIAGSGLVTLRPNANNVAIQVGAGATDAAGVLAITDTELDQITTTGGITIGSSTNTGGITVVGAADQATGATIAGGTFTLLSNSGTINVNATLTNAIDTTLQTTSGNIVFGAAGSVDAGTNVVNLTATGGSISGNAATFNNVTAATLNATASSGIGNTNALETAVTNLNFANTTNAVQFTNSVGGAVTVSGTNAGTGAVNITETTGDLVVGAADIVTNSGAVTLTNTANASSIISAAGSDISTTGGATAGAAVTLVADNMDLVGATTSGTATTTLRQFTNGTQIDLGGPGANGTVLGISSPELDTITAGMIKIGNSNTGDVTVTSAIAPTGTGTLSIQSGTTISQNSNLATITETNLALRAVTGITLTANGSSTAGEGNTVDNLAAITSGAAAINFRNNATMTVGTIDSVDGVSTANGAIGITVAGNSAGATNLLVDRVRAGTTTPGGTITLTASNAGAGAANIFEAPLGGGTGDVAIDIQTSGSMVLDAKTAIGQPVGTAAEAIEISAGTLTPNSGAGGVYLTQTGDVTLGAFTTNGDFAFTAIGTVTVGGAMRVDGNTTLKAQGTSADVIISNAITRVNDAAGSFTMQADRNIVFNTASTNPGTTVGSFTAQNATGSGAGATAVTFNADRDALGGGAIYVNAGSTIDSNNGAVILGGGLSPSTVAAIGNAATSGTNAILGTSGNSMVNGITIEGQILAGTGNVTLTGQSKVTSANVAGVVIRDGGNAGVPTQILTTTGNITINGVGDQGAGNTQGVLIDGVSGTATTTATVQTTSGTIAITGSHNSPVTLASNAGVLVTGGAVISSTSNSNTAGAVTLTGTGGAGSGNFDNGVVITGTSTVVSVDGAALNLVGTGGGGGATGGASNVGVQIAGAADVKSIGSGKVTLTGTGGATNGGGNLGIEVTGTNTQLRSTSTGATALRVDLVGTGGAGSGAADGGILIDSSAQVSTATGNIAFTGTGGGGGGADASNVGVTVANSAKVTTTSSGSVAITGTGGASNGGTNYGIAVLSAGQVESTQTVAGAGTITFTGTGGSGTGNTDAGILVNGSGTKVTTTVGNITFTGTGGADTTGTTNHGIVVANSAIVETKGVAQVTLDGTGSVTANGGTNYGILVDSSGTVRSTGSTLTGTSGKITLIGSGGLGTGSDDGGIRIANAGSVRTKDAEIEFQGFGGTDTTGGASYGIVLDGGIVSTTGDGSILLTGVGGAAAGGANTGISTLNSALIESTAANGVNPAGTITLAGTGGAADAGPGDHGIAITGTSTVSSKDGAIAITGIGGPLATTTGGSNNVGVIVYTGSEVKSTGLAVIGITGTGGDGTNQNRGVQIDVGGKVTGTSTSTGNITITGTGTGTGTDNYGVHITSNTAAASVISSAGTGAISITGTGSSTGTSDNVGVAISNTTAGVTGSNAGSQITTAQTGGITITGTGRGTTSNNYGVSIGGAALVSTAGNGTVAITGTGSATGTSGNAGILLASDADITSTKSTAGAGTLTLTGTGGAGSTTDNAGIVITGAGTSIVSSVGAIAATGTGAGTGASGYGVALASGAKIQSTNTATIGVTGTGANTAGNLQQGVRVDGATITTVSGDVTLAGVANGSGTGSAGVLIANTGKVESTGSADLFITGTGANGAPGIASNDGTTTVGTNTIGSATMTGDVLLRSLAGTGIALTNVNIVTQAATPGADVTINLVGGGNAVQVTNSGSIVASGLRIINDSTTSAVTLDSTSNNVNFLAANLTGLASTLSYTDSTGYAISTLTTDHDANSGNADTSTSGLTVGTVGTTANTIQLTAGAAVTQSTASDNVTTDGLNLLGAGNYTLTNIGNNITVLNGNVTTSGTSFIKFTDTNSVAIQRVVTPQAAGNNVTITAGAGGSGSITDFTPAGTEGSGNENIVTHTAILSAASGTIGAATADPDLDTDAVVLRAATTGAGNGIYITETNDVQLGDATSGISAAGDLVISTTAGSITTTTTAASSIAFGGNATISAGGTTSDLTISTNVVGTGSAGNTLRLNADNSIFVNTGADVSTTNAMNVVFNSDFDGSGAGRIKIGSTAGGDAGSVITSNGGNITLGGGNVNPALNAALGTSTTTAGVELSNGAQLQASTGNISIRGQSASGTTTVAGGGVNVLGGSIVQTTTGSITIDGKVDTAAGTSAGVQLDGTNTKVTSATGNIGITGSHLGTATGTFNRGIVMTTNAAVETTGSGTVTLTGTGGTGASATDNYGIQIASGADVISSQATAGAGTLTLTGTAAATTGASNVNLGVFVTGAGTTVTSKVGDVAITGTSNATGTGQYNIGVLVANDAIVSTTGVANVTVTGTGAASTGKNDYGVAILADGKIRSTVATGSLAQGTITISGTASGSGNSDGGVALGNADGLVTASATGGDISSVDGAISVTGISNSTGLNAYGIGAKENSSITSTGIATTSLIGTGGTGASGTNYGVWVLDTSDVVSSGSGATTITGTGRGTGNSNTGVVISDAGTTVTTVSGLLTIGGTSNATGSGTTNRGVLITTAADVISTGSGNIVITGTGATTAGNSNEGLTIESSGTSVDSQGTGLITLTGTGNGTASGNVGVVVNTTALVTSVTGNIGITGTSAATGTGSTNHGVDILGGGDVTSTGAAKINIVGTGAATSGSGSYGVLVTGTGSSVQSTANNAAATITISGDGFGTGGSASGVVVESSALVTSLTGNIGITGDSKVTTGSGNNNYGVHVASAADVTTTGAATITLTGSGGTTSGTNNEGVYIQGTGTPGQTTVTSSATTGGTITIGGTARGSGGTERGVVVDAGGLVQSKDGAIAITGTSSASAGNNNVGIVVASGADVISTGIATINLTGTGAATTGTDNYGVYLAGNASAGGTSIDSQASSLGGAITIGGTGQGTGGTERGVFMDSSARVTSVSGNIGITGTSSATGGSNNSGVVMATNADVITTGTANVSITGNGGNVAAGSNQYGIQLLSGADVKSTGSAVGSGTILLDGNAGAGTDDNIGVYLTDIGTSVTSVRGNITLLGDAAVGGTPGTGNRGVAIENTALVSSTAQANIVVTGNGAAGTAANYGIQLANGADITSSSTGTITLTGTGGAGSGNNNFGVEIQSTGTTLTAVNGNVTITGTGGGSAATTNNYGVNVEGAALIETSGTASIGITGTGGTTTGGSNYGVRVSDASTTIRSTATGGNITITGDGKGSGASETGIRVTTSALVTTVGAGNLALVGTGSTTGTGTNYGIQVDGGADITSTKATATAGTITLTGTGGGTTGSNNYGVFLTGAGTSVTSVVGNVVIGGTGGGTGSSTDNVGVLIAGDSDVQTSGVATVAINGDGGTTSGDRNYGVQIDGSGTAVTSTATGANVTITGNGKGTGADEIGVRVSNAALVTTAGAGNLALVGNGSTTGMGTNYGIQVDSDADITSTKATATAGTVNLTGTGGGTSGNSNYGVFLTGAGTSVTSVVGNVVIGGTGGGTGSSTDNVGVLIASDVDVQTTDVATIAITGTGGATSGAGNRGVQVTGGGSSVTTTSAALRLTGTGAGTGGTSTGVQLDTGALLSTATGSVTVIGTGAGAMATDAGVAMQGATAEATGSGSVVLIGTGGAGAAGIETSGGGNTIGNAGMTGNILMRSLSGTGMISDASIVTTANVTLNSEGGTGFTQTAGGSIVADGLRVLGSGTFTIDQAGNAINTIAGDLTATSTLTLVEAGGLSIGTLTTDSIGNPVTVTTSTGLNIAGDANLTTTGNLTQVSKAVITGTTTIDVGTGNDILLNTVAANDFGTLAVTAANNLSVTNTGDIDLGTITLGTTIPTTPPTAGGNLTVSATGAVTDSGTLTIPGIASFTGGNMTLDTPTNNFSSVTLNSTGDVTLVDATEIVFNTSNVTGALTATAGGSINSTGLVSVGSSTFTSASGGIGTLLTPFALATNNFITLVITGNVPGSPAAGFVTNAGGGLLNLLPPTGLVQFQIVEFQPPPPATASAFYSANFVDLIYGLMTDDSYGTDSPSIIVIDRFGGYVGRIPRGADVMRDGGMRLPAGLSSLTEEELRRRGG